MTTPTTSPTSAPPRPADDPRRDRLDGIRDQGVTCRLSSASGDETIRLWSLPDGRLLRTLKGHTMSVDGIVFRAYPKMGTGSEQVRFFPTMNIGCEVPVPILG